MGTGALLLKFQTERWAHRYTFLPVAPRAGDLWLFPGYVPHAVMPRTLRPSPGTQAAAQAATAASGCDGLRVSVAFNIHKASTTDRAEAAVIQRLLPGVRSE